MQTTATITVRYIIEHTPEQAELARERIAAAIQSVKMGAGAYRSHGGADMTVRLEVLAAVIDAHDPTAPC